MADHHSPNLLSLPAEIRLQIYNYLLVPEQETTTLSIRTVDPERYRTSFSYPPHHRKGYSVMGGRFRAATLSTTYHLVPAIDHTGSLIAPIPDLCPSILGVSRLCHAEAAPILYSRYTFDFGSDVESVVPFLSDLTPLARKSIRNVNLVKRALPYTKDFDRYEWRDVCEYLASECELEQLGLRVFGGRVPGRQWMGEHTILANINNNANAALVQGGAGVTTTTTAASSPANSPTATPGTTTPTTIIDTDMTEAPTLPRFSEELPPERHVFSKSDFPLISRFEGMEWVRQLCAIKGLRNLDVGAIWESCPPPCSNALAFFVNFSESIEGGFAEFLRENMVANAA